MTARPGRHGGAREARPAARPPGARDGTVRTPAGRGARRRRAAPRRLARWMLATAAAALAAVALWTVLRPQPPRPAAPPVPDPAASLSGSEAYGRALALVAQGRDAESLAYFRHAIASLPRDLWAIHGDYASALYNLTRDYQMRRGIQVPLLRSACERVDVMQQVLRELYRAEVLAERPQDLAIIKARRAQMMAVWGFPWEAIIAYRQASQLDPTKTDLTQTGDRYATLMRIPDRVPKPLATASAELPGAHRTP